MLQVIDANLNVDATRTFSHGFPAGSITVVLGANRSGKTDLCRLIAGLHTRARGEVRLDDDDLGQLAPRRRPVSLVYQDFVNYPNLTVAENIASPMRAKRLAAPTRRARVDELAARLQISDLLDRYPHQLSGGQQQRLAIARALAKDARVVLLDEPLVNLDFKLREALEYELRDLLRASGTVVIYTSSDPRDAFALGDELLLLAAGTKIQSGPPLEVYREPGSFVAMELLADPGINRFEHAGADCALRPEHVYVEAAAPGTDTVDFDMHVTAYETSGDESFIHGQVQGRSWVVRARGMHDLRRGSTVALSARVSDVVRF